MGFNYNQNSLEEDIVAPPTLLHPVPSLSVTGLIATLFKLHSAYDTPHVRMGRGHAY